MLDTGDFIKKKIEINENLLASSQTFKTVFIHKGKQYAKGNMLPVY